MVITIAHLLKIPTACILELLRNRPPIEVVLHPVKRWHTVSCVGFEKVEERCESESTCCQDFPEANPLKKASVFVDDLSFCKTECRIWVHCRGLHKWLELVTRVSRSALKPKNTFNRLLPKNRITKSGCNVGEFLVLAPLNLVFCTFIVVIVRRRRAAL